MRLDEVKKQLQDAKKQAKYADSEGEQPPPVVPLRKGQERGLTLRDVPANVDVLVDLETGWTGLFPTLVRFCNDGGRLDTRIRFHADQSHWSWAADIHHCLRLVEQAAYKRSRKIGDVELEAFQDDHQSNVICKVISKSTDLAKVCDQASKIAEDLLDAARSINSEAAELFAKAESSLGGQRPARRERQLKAIDAARSPIERAFAIREMIRCALHGEYGLGVIAETVNWEQGCFEFVIPSNNCFPGVDGFHVQCRKFSGPCGEAEITAAREAFQDTPTEPRLVFLISWDGHSNSALKEMARSEHNVEIIPLTRADLVNLASSRFFIEVLMRAWEEAGG